MKAILTFLNDWRDSIFYTMVAGAYVVLAFTGHARMLCFVLNVIQARELLRSLWWIPEVHPKKYLFGIIGLNTACAIGAVTAIAALAYSFAPREITSDLLECVFCISVNFIILWRNSGDLIREVGLWPFTKVNASIYWHDLFDWPRKQKPPEHRWRESSKALARLMEKVREAMAPAPMPVPAAREAV
jgi:hypothetical protein